jgi:RNA polymerase sigma-70 factor, ECF subfamily
VTVPENGDSDEVLLERLCGGQKEALAVLFRRHARAVRNVAFRILRNEAEADDLLQDVFIFIFQKAEQFDAGQGRASSWIIQMAYHRAFDRRRYLNSRHFYTNEEIDDATLRQVKSEDVMPYHERSIEGVFGKELTARFNARLSLGQRDTIRLHFFEGHTLREIAELTGESLVNVRSHYYRGLERLRKYVLHDRLRSK